VDVCKNDAPLAAELLFQDSATPIMEGIVDLHNKIMCIMTYIGTIIFGFIFINILFHNADVNKKPKYLKHNLWLEIIWTIIPAIILIGIAIPSFGLLYAIDGVISPALTIKVIGHQWYWSYEDMRSESCDVNLVAENDLINGDKRLLQTDNALHLPTSTHIRFVITSSDVIHSWAVPSLGIKLDAVPGRLSQTPTIIGRDGHFFGQCSEICGINHGGMPIEILSMSLNEFKIGIFHCGLPKLINVTVNKITPKFAVSTKGFPDTTNIPSVMPTSADSVL